MEAVQFAILELTLMFIGWLIIQVIKTATEQIKEAIDFWESRKMENSSKNPIEKRNYLFSKDNFINYQPNGKDNNCKRQ